MASTDPKKSDERVRILSPAESVPVFNCVIHLRKTDEGRVQARFANIDSDAIVVDSERDALKQAVETFKRIATEYRAQGKQIPIKTEPLPASPDEQTRLIAIHL